MDHQDMGSPRHVAPRMGPSASPSDIRYSFHYTLQFSALQSEEISIKFRTKFQDYWGGCCLGCCVSSGIITARELLTAMPLPGFSEDSNWVHFTQDGVLSWVGDGSKVQKVEHPLS